MTTPAPILDALDVAEDLILPVLAALSPIGNAHWSVAPPATAGALRRYGLNVADPSGLARCYVAQHQDGGGSEAPVMHSRGWAGLITVRCLSAVEAQARAGFALAAAAMQALSAPAGYGCMVRWQRPVAVPPDLDGIHTRAGSWRVTLRKV